MNLLHAHNHLGIEIWPPEQTATEDASSVKLDSQLEQTTKDSDASSAETTAHDYQRNPIADPLPISADPTQFAQNYRVDGADV